MESKLSRLFDFQKYDSNPKLDKVISSVENRYPEDLKLLSEDFLGQLNAAGSVDVMAMREAKNQK